MRWLIPTYSGSACRPDPLRQRSLKNRCLHRIPPFCSVFFSRRSDIFLFFALFCLFLTGLSDPLSTPTAAFSVHPQPYLEHMFFQKVKKTGTPANIPVSPKSLNLHTACMHVSAFVSVCFVCGIPDDALSYIFCMTVKFNPALCVTECRSLVCELLFDYSPEYISELLFCQDIFFTLFFLPYQATKRIAIVPLYSSSPLSFVRYWKIHTPNSTIQPIWPAALMIVPISAFTIPESRLMMPSRPAMI